MTSELNAFRAIDFNWTRQLKSVCQDPRYHVPSLHHAAVDDITQYFQHRAVTTDPDSKPLGRIVVGPAGIGKTHLVGELRRRAWELNGWFVLLDFVGIKDFWSSVALGFLSSLHVRMPDGKEQYARLIRRLAGLLDVNPQLKDLLARYSRQPRELLSEIVRLLTCALGRDHRDELLHHHDVVTALILLIAKDLDCASVAHAWLQGLELDKDDVRPLGIRSVKREPIDIVRGLSWLMSLTGPTLIAIDQIDAIVSESNVRPGPPDRASDEGLREAQSILESLAGGLMELHEVTPRSVTVVACLEATWELLRARASVAVTDRYMPPTVLRPLTGNGAGHALVAARLNEAYAAQKFRPPFDTWPFATEAFAGTAGFSPRQLLKACEAHRQACLDANAVTVLQSFTAGHEPVPSEPGTGQGSVDRAFADTQKAATIGSLLDLENEGQLQLLLRDTLGFLALHFDLPGDIDVAVHASPAQRRPSLHGRLSFTLRGEGDREKHFCFLILGHTNPIAFQSRLKAAMTASGIERALEFRHLFVVRRDNPPGGKKTADLVKQFCGAGGRFVAPTDDDLRVFVALQTMAKGDRAVFDKWLRDRKPLFATSFFTALGLCPPSFLGGSTTSGAATAEGSTAVRQPAVGSRTPRTEVSRSVPIGRRCERGVEDPVESIPADVLPRHTAMLAGSGSGKTVLIRRIVEEAAVIGIPALILDSNNDLARLGDAWPSRPPSFTDADAEKAAAYQRAVDVTIWTPGLASGRPLSLAMLPDFSAVAGDADELDQAVEMARATLEPLISATGKRARLISGVLANALRAFALQGGGELTELIEFLSDLPEAVSQINDATKLAIQIADQLRAAIATNPLLRRREQPVDCRILFEGEASGRTRISVINLSGLASDDVRNNFVNQLNMALFTWIKRHPSETGRLYVIDEAQNFAPSQQTTACKQSIVSLVSQARKYGLGMIFATQTPKGIDNKVVSNCTTHFYGKMNSPAAITATQELLQAKGGVGGDIAKLAAGEFYFATEATPRPLKIRTPLCLTHHPKNPLTVEEVIRRARCGE